LEKNCPSVTLSTTNPTWPDPGSNPGRHGGKPATNRLSYGMAKNNINFVFILQKYKMIMAWSFTSLYLWQTLGVNLGSWVMSEFPFEITVKHASWKQ
jgi:hypothetical protein